MVLGYKFCGNLISKDENMAIGPRNYINMSFYHIMVQGINKEYIFNKDEDKRQYLKFINKVKGVNRVTYDISSKPPATIEWE